MELLSKNGLEKQQMMIEGLKVKCLKILKDLNYKEMNLRMVLSMDDHDLD